MRRLTAAFIAILMLVSLSVPAAFAAPSTAKTSKAVPKVVFVVGPAGVATDGYRTQARAAAAIARNYTPDVVEVYSPDATWPAVKQALKGASLVVYMGHGNGWPSPYRDALYPPSQNGFGLNPKAGGNDETHQYFGEADLAQVKLARNAVVLLNHLCYASGNTEPGLAEGTLAQAEQRVDNYAAGFIKAGAAAVIAEAWSSPSYMVRAILGGGRSIQTVWQSAPSANNNRFAFASDRSKGYVAQMDPESATSGFTRSLVMKGSIAPHDVKAGAAGSPNAATAVIEAAPLDPSLATSGLKLGTPDIAKLPTAGTKGKVDVPFTIKNKAVLKGLEASVRWDPIDVTLVPTDPATEVGAATGDAAGMTPTTGAANATPDASAATPPAAAPAGQAAVTPATDPSSPVATDPSSEVAGTPATKPVKTPTKTAVKPAPLDPFDLADQPTGLVVASDLAAPTTPVPVELRVEAPVAEYDLVVPEQVGDVVAPAKVTIGKKALSVPVAFPTTPGRYRLTISLHDAEGVAYDAATQAMVPSLIVRVTGDFDGAIQVAPTAELSAGSQAAVDLRVENLGKTAWGHQAVSASADLLIGSATDKPALVVGRWIPLSPDAALPADPKDQTVQARLPVGLKPGASAAASLSLNTPTAPGQYLLLLDIVTPERGSLVAAGADPTLIRVTVTAGATR